MKLMFTLFWSFALSVSLFSCTEDQRAEQSQDKLRILATTGMIADMAKNIVGDSAEVTSIMGPGVDPHLYKATQGDLFKLKSADIVLYNGLHLEGKMGEILEKLARTKTVVAVSDALDKKSLLEDSVFQGNFDPHIWFDVELWRRCVPGVLEALVAKDSLRQQYYTMNAQKFTSQLDSLDNWVRSQIASIPAEQRTLITAHDAFSYFGNAYGIEVRGLQGISTLSEFGLRDRIDLIDFISDRQIKAVFVESSVSEKNILSIIEGCQYKGHEVEIGGKLYSDAMGSNDTPEGTYIGMVNHNVSSIVKALK
jgi:manganese/zinc/iron transport system substrate-binding protein